MILPLHVLIFGVILFDVSAQFVPPPNDLIATIGHAGVPIRYKAVPPGICELDPNVKSYSGYADVAEDQHIFWWFFEARNADPETAPLTVWINGGPGSSSMMGLFQEIGPCGVDFFGNVYSNPYSWSNASNILFIDQPSQVGFSYTQPVPGFKENGDTKVLPNVTCPEYVSDPSTCGTYSNPNITLTANSTVNAAPNFWKTLQGFMGAFPEYSRNGFNLATESYGGHYGPVFAAYIERQNALDVAGARKIQLETLMIGNGWFDPIINYQAFYNFTVSPGNTYDYSPFDASTEALLFDNLYGVGNCLDQLKDCKETGLDSVCSKADSFCMEHVEDLYRDALGRDVYDIRELAPDPFPYNFFVDYLNTPTVQTAIGAYTNFSTFSNTVKDAFANTGDDAREVNSIEDIRYLLGLNVTVVLYAGDADFDCNWIGGEAVAEEVGAPGFDEAGYKNLQTSDGIVHGQVKQAGKFSFIRIYESGHMVPFYQPLAALTLFERAISGLDTESGTQVVHHSYVTDGTPKSTYREGNATMQWDVVPNTATFNVMENKPGELWTARLEKTKGSMQEEYLRQYPFQSRRRRRI
ncbi:Alpha/Beta hydrolase protein [Xylariales sp. AK1849]|nr:Alpha/Beta hydrolase protein [Xylariales sp. AK1849]